MKGLSVRRVLVLGGNHYFGKKLVRILLDNGDEVTLLNRGNLDDGFESRVKRIVCDRHNIFELEKVITQSYDIVFDQSCFDYDQARIACEVFNNKTKKYIFTSSISAYNVYGASIKESIFDPYSFVFSKKETKESNYGEAKRQAEVSFFKHATFPVTAVRFPIVLDEDDATGRLQFHVNKIKNTRTIYFSNLNSKISFISANDAAKALFELSMNEFSGPINVASSVPISLRECMGYIENIVEKKLILSYKGNAENTSPYNISEDWFVDCSKLEGLGIEIEEIRKYLPQMISLVNDQL